jgi:enoyl-CoA hydratase/carnithine racemase
METAPILFESRGRVAVITLNRPESLNAINPPLHSALTDAMIRVRDDPDSWVGILTGAGERAFCAGADLKWRAANEEQVRMRAGSGVRPPFTWPQFGCYKPLIAAVNGYAVGGGLELAMACDIIVAAEHAQFGLPAPRRGLMADGGGVQRFHRRDRAIQAQSAARHLPRHWNRGSVGRPALRVGRSDERERRGAARKFWPAGSRR